VARPSIVYSYDGDILPPDFPESARKPSWNTVADELAVAENHEGKAGV
jgi:hypothetical protein